MKFYPLSDQGECEVSVEIHERAPFVALGLKWQNRVEAWLSPDEAREIAQVLLQHSDELERKHDV